VTLKAASLPPGTQILQGNTRLTYSSLGVAIPVDVGELELVVATPGHVDKRYRLVLGEGARETLQVESGALVPRKAVDTKPAPARGPSPFRAVGVLGMGLGAALITVGGATGLAVINAKDSVEQDCDARGACSPRGVAAAERGETLSLVSTVAFAAGVGCAGLGAWLWLSNAPQSVRVGIELGPGLARVHGRF
jgi:hypothetical protein